MTDWNPVLLWRDDRQEAAKHGPGISRPRDGERTKPFKLLVRAERAPAMRVTLAAPTKRDAIRFAQNRWPGAAVEVVL